MSHKLIRHYCQDPWFSPLSAGWACPQGNHLTPAQLTAPGQIWAVALRTCTSLLPLGLEPLMTQ